MLDALHLKLGASSSECNERSPKQKQPRVGARALHSDGNAWSSERNALRSEGSSFSWEMSAPLFELNAPSSKFYRSRFLRNGPRSRLPGFMAMWSVTRSTVRPPAQEREAPSVLPGGACPIGQPPLLS
jgi:hypothetical protein